MNLNYFLYFLSFFFPFYSPRYTGTGNAVPGIDVDKEKRNEYID